jgi:diacylglycerol kinase family enzyme
VLRCSLPAPDCPPTARIGRRRIVSSADQRPGTLTHAPFRPGAWSLPPYLPHQSQAQERFTQGPRDAERLARAALRGGAEVVVAVGGDGTINEVVNGFFEEGASALLPEVAEAPQEAGPSGRGEPRRRRPALAVLPLGTGSDLARTFGWPPGGGEDATAAACDRIRAGDARPLDVGVVTAADAAGNAGAVRRAFVNIASAGVSSRAAAAVGYYAALGGFMAYQLSAAHGLMRWRRVPVRVRADGGPWLRLPAATDVAVANGQFYGGGMRIAPEADPCDGVLSVVALDGIGVRRFVRDLGKLRAGAHLSLAGVYSLSGRRIEVELESGEPGGLPLELDGEVGGYAPAAFHILPGALSLLR